MGVAIIAIIAVRSRTCLGYFLSFQALAIIVIALLVIVVIALIHHCSCYSSGDSLRSTDSRPQMLQ